MLMYDCYDYQLFGGLVNIEMYPKWKNRTVSYPDISVSYFTVERIFFKRVRHSLTSAAKRFFKSFLLIEIPFL
jgi:hypothetical protein